jgi:hypothetical protein
MGEFHSFIRVSNYYCTTYLKEEERQGLMYMNMLTGRKMYEADWLKVIDERKHEPEKDFVSYDPVRGKWSRVKYLEDFDDALSSAYLGMYSKPKAVDVSNFVQFWKRRRAWVAKGSTVLNQLPREMLSYTVSFLDHLKGTIELRHNKKSLFEHHEIIDLLKESTDTWNATKVVPKLNETGKERELLPGTLMHYVIFSYVLYAAEKQASIGSTRLNVNDDDNLMYYDKKMVKGIHHMLYDWANFNSQHTTRDMARVIEMLEHIPGMPEDYSYFCRAIAESFSHMWLIDPEGGKHKLEKGLFSGWRGTTWINSVLNYIYVNIGIKCCERLYPDFNPLYLDHGGDDLDVGFESPQDCFRMMRVMDAIGYEAKAIKQMVDKKSEFFRNTITQEGVFASPCRALANFVSGNWESGGAKELSEKANSILDQVAKMKRRGVDAEFCQHICRMALKHWLKIKVDDEWFEIRDEVIHGDFESGGLGIPDRDGCVWKLEPPILIVDLVGLNVKLPGAYCSQDYVEMVKEELAKVKLEVVGEESLIEKLAKESYDLKQFEERALFSELNKVKTQVVDKIPVVSKKWDPMYFEEFIRWTKSGDRGLSLGKMEMFAEFIGHVVADGMVLEYEDLMNVYLEEPVTPEVVRFRGDVYYRRLIPDFLANNIDKFVRRYGNNEKLSVDDMQEVFKTVAYMAYVMYNHHA